MPWFKVDDNLAFHHKVVAAGNPAMGLWVRAGSLCAQQLTDGFIPDHMIEPLGTKGQAEKLVKVGLWHRERGGYRFHEFAERQPSKADVEAERAAAKERMRDYRAKKKGATQTASAQVSDLGSGDVQPNERRTNGEVLDSFGDPDPTHPDPSRPDPPIEAIAGKPAAKRATQIPADFRPTDKHLELAAELGVDLQREWPSFVDHHTAKGSAFKDWNAALRNWIRNAPKFAGNRAAAQTDNSWMRRRPQ